jgi:DNA-binding MarR family transcriptional regulator
LLSLIYIKNGIHDNSLKLIQSFRTGRCKRMDEQLEIALKGGYFKRLLDLQLDEIKKEHDLKKVEIEVLFYLSKCGSENTPTDITKRLNLNRGHVSQAIDSLLKKNLIAAVADEKDRRCMHYMITTNAVLVIDEIANVKKKMDEQILKGITKDEIDVYKKITEKMIRNIREII